MIRGGAVGIAAGYGIDSLGVGVRVPVGAICIPSYGADRPWGLPSLLSNGYKASFPDGKAAGP
jgi:hypothetical protein